jgi:NADP-dependent 3-hydroxy acid dehydrogenase YdfG
MEEKKYALITGASSGFGEACAELLAQKGFGIIACARREERLKRLCDKLRLTYNCECIPLCFDIRKQEEIANAIKGLPKNAIENLSVLINNAGLAAGRDPIHSGSLVDWEEMLDTNVKGLLYLTRIISPIMAMKKRGHIINISSIAGKEVYPDGNVYCASKHAVEALSKAMRIDLLSHGIKVTNIAPGAAETEFSLVRFKGDVDKSSAVYDGFVPLKAQDIAEAVWFAINQPMRVTIADMTILPAAQGSSMHFHRSFMEDS